jgi:hypothetical protein
MNHGVERAINQPREATKLCFTRADWLRFRPAWFKGVSLAGTPASEDLFLSIADRSENLGSASGIQFDDSG